MLDIIFNSYVVDYGNLLRLSVYNTLSSAMVNGSSVSSIIESEQTQVENLLTEYNKLMSE